MKYYILQITFVLLCARLLYADDLSRFTINSNQLAAVQEKLKAYEKDNLDLDSTFSVESSSNLVAYYFQRSNTVSIKAKLPIARAMDYCGLAADALPLAKEYTKAYPTNWRGWRCLGYNYVVLKQITNALEAAQQTAKFGDPEGYKLLAGLALTCGRMDIAKEIIPKLLEYKNEKKTSGKDKLDVVNMLLTYGLMEDEPDVFLSALKGISMQEILSNNDTRDNLSQGCKNYPGNKEMMDWCKRCEAARINEPSTNASPAAK